jgi:hypothetical protein
MLKAGDYDALHRTIRRQGRLLLKIQARVASARGGIERRLLVRGGCHGVVNTERNRLQASQGPRLRLYHLRVPSFEFRERLPGGDHLWMIIIVRAHLGDANVGIWLAVGAGIGAALGAATHNMAVWLAVGVALGVAVDLIVQGRRRK